MATLRIMTAMECVTLLDAMMRSADPETYAKRVQNGFDRAGRDGDALVVSMMSELHRSGEIETLMCLRAEWSRPSDADQS